MIYFGTQKFIIEKYDVSTFSKTMSTAVKLHFDKILQIILKFCWFSKFQKCDFMSLLGNLPLIFFLEKIIVSLFQEKNNAVISQYLLLCFNICLSLIWTYNKFSFVGQSENTLWPQKHFHQKVWHLGFLTHFQTHP